MYTDHMLNLLRTTSNGRLFEVNIGLNGM